MYTTTTTAHPATRTQINASIAATMTLPARTAPSSDFRVEKPVISEAERIATEVERAAALARAYYSMTQGEARQCADAYLITPCDIPGKVSICHKGGDQKAHDTYQVDVETGFCNCWQGRRDVPKHNNAMIAANEEPWIRCKHGWIVAQTDLEALIVSTARIAVPEPTDDEIADAEALAMEPEPVEPANEYSYSQRERA